MAKVTKAQIAQWKEENHNDVTLIKINDLECYFKYPDRKTLSLAQVVSQQDPMKFNDVIIEDCWLGGDEEIKTNPRLYALLCSQLGDHIAGGTASLEKL